MLPEIISTATSGEATQMLGALQAGESQLGEQFFALVYDELRRLAAIKLERELPGQTLTPTALVHEAYLRLFGTSDEIAFSNRRHFFGAAAEAMRRILIETARRKGRRKRQGQRELARAPLPTTIPKRVPTMTPYIYSRDEISRLLEAIPAARHGNNLMEPNTLRAILLVLYGAGLRRGEVLRLTIADVDLPNSIHTIRNTKFFKSRLVPISRDLIKALSDYARWRATAHPSSDTSGTFFVNRCGEAIYNPP